MQQATNLLCQNIPITIQTKGCATPAFTPDGDQITDELCVRSELDSNEVEILLIIYNRWPQELFRGTSFGDCWDGTFQGAPVAPDVYAYYLQVMCAEDAYTKKRDLMILR